MAILVVLASILGWAPAVLAQVENPQGGSVGMEGRISAPPPTRGATISVPGNGQTFTQLPITVSGICPDDLLVKLFKNNVFAGSVQCKNGSYTLITDLFSGSNELVARVYDALDQAGPDSNKVTISYNDARPGASPRPTLTSNIAKLGVNSGQELSWTISLSGGSGPYALSIDWGDGSQAELMSVSFAGPVEIKHKYKSAGVYNIIIKLTDRDGASAYLQLVGIVNGAISQEQQAAAKGQEDGSAEGGAGSSVKRTILWQPAAASVPLIMATFWLGRKYELRFLKKKIEHGERPF